MPQVLSTKPPSDLIPDLVFLVGPAREPSRVIIVEIQTDMTREKRRQWPRYAAVLWAHYECPVDLLVICPDEASAQSCAEPIETSLDRYICFVKVLFPSMVPHLRTRKEVEAYPGLGVLSLSYHGTDPKVTEAFVAGVALLPPTKRTLTITMGTTYPVPRYSR